MKRRILLVDDEVAVLLTLKAVLEISGFEVDTAASAKEGRSKLHTHEYQMVITDMRMESEASGLEVIKAAREAVYQPAVALLTAFPAADEDWQEMGADKMLVKPMHTRVLLEQLEKLLISHEAKLSKETNGRKAAAKKAPAKSAAKVAAKKAPVKKAVVARKLPAKKAPAKKVAAKKTSAKKAAKKVSKKN
ncbi:MULTISPECIES: response regulator [Acidobacteriaceae]|uniref:response regulator n=1 Tax=Acidobacteriaceae TaxID=204434 RepID=UPI00131CDB06|nr:MULTISPECIES: response regulator [Acidobacteriaceae]MDW5264870.1 response regulator [Edaphobacter sp.]